VFIKIAESFRQGYKMAVNKEAYYKLRSELDPQKVTLVAVSKTRPEKDILELYELGHRDFGENYVQEILGKAANLPADIRWHFIGHLQRNKVKSIIPIVHLVHGVDSLKLLREINSQAAKLGRKVSCLFQVHIATEESKFGMDHAELDQALGKTDPTVQLGQLNFVRVIGLMGMASFTDDQQKIRDEFRNLKNLFDGALPFFSSGIEKTELSMGMSNDYKIAIEEGSSMVRIGSLLFGERIYPQNG
jgi:pyridoxal phosphate enzyme (YggS family)